MNMGVHQGVKEGKRFIEYVQYLADEGYVPPNGKERVGHIRKKGNEATHEIALMNEGDAKDLITFIEMPLKFVYEFPSKITPKQTPLNPIPQILSNPPSSTSNKIQPMNHGPTDPEQRFLCGPVSLWLISTHMLVRWQNIS